MIGWVLAAGLMLFCAIVFATSVVLGLKRGRIAASASRYERATRDSGPVFFWFVVVTNAFFSILSFVFCLGLLFVALR